MTSIQNNSKKQDPMDWLSDAPLFQACLIDEDGNEIPITRDMIDKSCDALIRSTEKQTGEKSPQA